MELKKFMVEIFLSVQSGGEQIHYELKVEDHNAENVLTDLESRKFIRVASPNGKFLTTININHVSEITIVELT